MTALTRSCRPTGGLNEDVVRIAGTFYDLNCKVEGNDLIVGAVTDDTYQWAGGNLRFKDFFLPGGDIINFMIGRRRPQQRILQPWRQ